MRNFFRYLRWSICNLIRFLLSLLSRKSRYVRMNVCAVRIVDDAIIEVEVEE